MTCRGGGKLSYESVKPSGGVQMKNSLREEAMKTKTVHVCAVLLAAGILAFVQPLHAGYEAVSHAVVYSEWMWSPLFQDYIATVGTNPCHPGGAYINPRGHEFQDKWSTYIDNYEQDGKEYSIIRDWTDSQVWGKNWTDPDFFNWGEDNVSQTGTDWADVIMYFGHGGACCDGVPGIRSCPGEFRYLYG